MSWPIQALFDAFTTLLAAAPGTPPLAVHDTNIPSGAVPPYAKLDFYIETPDGLTAPDAVSLTFDSDVVDARAYIHCVGADPQAARAARAVAGRVRAAVLNRTLTVAGRVCSPIRWVDGEIPGLTVYDLVDVYGWRAHPA